MRAETKPREKEYIIDVPLALKCSAAGLGWPARAITELRTGSLVQDDVRPSRSVQILYWRCPASTAGICIHMCTMKQSRAVCDPYKKSAYTAFGLVAGQHHCVPEVDGILHALHVSAAAGSDTV